MGFFDILLRHGPGMAVGLVAGAALAALFRPAVAREPLADGWIAESDAVRAPIPGSSLSVGGSMRTVSPTVTDAGREPELETARSDCPVPAERAAASVLQLRTFFRMSELTAGAGNSTEEVANALVLYGDGWSDAVLVGDPAVLPEVGALIAAELCGHPTALTTLMLLRIAERVAPGASDLRSGLRCVLREHTEEDVILATAIRAWSAARYGTAPELDSWRDRARSPMIRSLFSSAPSLTTESASALPEMEGEL